MVRGEKLERNSPSVRILRSQGTLKSRTDGFSVLNLVRGKLQDVVGRRQQNVQALRRPISERRLIIKKLN